MSEVVLDGIAVFFSIPISSQLLYFMSRPHPLLSLLAGSVCKNHQCQSNEDWCLVTYYRVYADDGSGEGKRERHECGNRNMRGESSLA